MQGWPSLITRCESKERTFKFETLSRCCPLAKRQCVKSPKIAGDLILTYFYYFLWLSTFSPVSLGARATVSQKPSFPFPLILRFWPSSENFNFVFMPKRANDGECILPNLGRRKMGGTRRTIKQNICHVNGPAAKATATRFPSFLRKIFWLMTDR